MRIAIAADEKNVSANIARRIGRAHYFIVYDMDLARHIALPNPFLDCADMADVYTAHLLLEQQVRAVIADGCCRYIYQFLTGKNIHVITGITGTVQDAVDRYQQGELNSGAAEGSGFERHRRRGRNNCRFGQRGFYSRVHSCMTLPDQAVAFGARNTSSSIPVEEQLENMEQRVKYLERAIETKKCR